MLMMVSRERQQFAVGIEAGVFDNTAEERDLLA